MGNVGTTATLIFIVVLFMAGLSIIIPEISTNPNLDDDSIGLLNNVTNEYSTNFQVQTTETVDPLTANQSSNCLGVEAFYKQSCLDRQEAQDSETETVRLTKIPSLFVTMFGVENENLVNLWLAAIVTLLTFYLSLQLYKFFRTGEVD